MEGIYSVMDAILPFAIFRYSFMKNALLALLFPMAAFMQEFKEMGLWMSVAFAVMYLFCMLAYDRLLLPLSMIYVNRIRPRFTFLK